MVGLTHAGAPSTVTATNGATLAEILKAGEWKSPAFMSYLDLDKLETEAVIEAHLEESACED